MFILKRSLWTVLPLSLAIVIAFATTPAYASTESERAREQAREILNQRKFGRDEKRPLSGNVERLSQWLGDGKEPPERVEEQREEQIEEQYEPRDQPQINPPAAEGAGTLATVIVVIVVALAVIGIGFLIFKLISNRTPKEKTTDEEIDLEIDWSDEEKVLEHVSDVQQLERLADIAESEGRLDVALRYRFRAGLLKLSEKNIIDFHPSVTNAQWQLIIADERFDSLTRDFNDVTYGKKPCDFDLINKSKTSWPLLVSNIQRIRNDES